MADEALDELVRRRRQDGLGRVVLDDPRAHVEDRDPVAELHGLVEVVRDEHDRLAQLLLQAQQLVLQPLAGDGVDGAERLVHQQDRRVGRQGPGHPDPLLLPAGQLPRVPVAVLLGVEVDEVEQLVDARGDAVLLPAEQPRHDRDVLGDRVVREQPRALDDVADATTQVVGVLVGDVLVADVDPTAGRLDQPVDHLHRRGLAAARRADEHDDLAGGDLERDVVDRGAGLPRVLLGDVLEQDPLPVRLLPGGGGGRGGLRHGCPWRSWLG